MSILTLCFALLVFALAYYAYRHEVGRCRLTVSEPELKAGLVSALDTTI
jgi:hypothetical protein